MKEGKGGGKVQNGLGFLALVKALSLYFLSFLSV